LVTRLLADTPFRPQFDAARAAADWRGFFNDVGFESLAARA